MRAIIRRPSTVLGWLLRDTALALVCGQIVLCASLVFYFRMDLQENEQRTHFQTATLLADEIFARDAHASVETFRAVAEEFSKLNPDARLFLLDDDARSLASVPDPGTTLQLPKDVVDRSLTLQLPKLPILMALPAEVGGATVPFSTALLPTADGAPRTLLVTCDSETAAELYRSGGVIDFLVALAPLLFAGAAVTLLITALVGSVQTRSLRLVAHTARRYLSGDRSARAPKLPMDEIGALGPAINNLADEIQSLEKRIAESELQRRSLLAGLAHDIGTPLTSLTGFLGLLRNNTTERQASESYFERARNSLMRVREMLGQIAALDRDDLHEIPFHPHDVDLERIIATAVTESALAAKAKHIHLEAKLGPIDHRLYGDPELLSRIVQNLVGNAIRYTPKGGTVIVHSAETNGRLLLQVEDTGIGIPPDEIPGLFDEYVRANESHHENMGGTGLGLAIVKRFVVLHGGCISVESTVGKGSIFSVLLPRSADDWPKNLEASSELSSSQKPAARSFRKEILYGTLLGLTPWLLPSRSSAYHVLLGLMIGVVGVSIFYSLPDRRAKQVYAAIFNVLFWLAVAMIARAELLVASYTISVGASFLMGASFTNSTAISLPIRVGVTFLGTSLLASTAIYFYAEQHLLGKSDRRFDKYLQQALPRIRDMLDSSPPGFDPAVRVGYFTRFAPQLNLLAVQPNGRVVGQSGIFESLYERFGNFDRQAFHLDNLVIPQLPVTIRTLEDDGDQHSIDDFYPVSLTRRNPRIFFFGIGSQVDRTIWRKISERSVVRFITLHFLLTLVLASIVAITVYRSLLRRLSFGHRILRQEEVDAPQASVDELDQVITLLAELRRTVSERGVELLSSVEEKRALVRAVDQSLSPPLTMLEQIINTVERSSLPAHDPLWDRAELIGDTMLRLVRELVEYARLMQQEVTLSDEPLDLVELIEDVISRDISVEHSRRVHAPPTVPLVVSGGALLSRAMELTVDASLFRNTLQIEVRIEGEETSGVNGKKIQAVFPVHQPDGETSEPADPAGVEPMLAYAALRRALVEAYLEKIGAKLKDDRGSWVIELSALA